MHGKKYKVSSDTKCKSGRLDKRKDCMRCQTADSRKHWVYTVENKDCVYNLDLEIGSETFAIRTMAIHL